MAWFKIIKYFGKKLQMIIVLISASYWHQNFQCFALIVSLDARLFFLANIHILQTVDIIIVDFLALSGSQLHSNGKHPKPIFKHNSYISYLIQTSDIRRPPQSEFLSASVLATIKCACHNVMYLPPWIY